MLTVWAIDEVAADAQIARQAMGSLIGSAGGIEKTGALGLTQKGTPNMSVQVAVGGVWIPGTVTTSQGPYFAYNSAVYERSIEAAGASNPRVDTIVAQIKDATYEGSERLPAIEALKGKEESGVKLEGSKSAGLAAVPHSCIVLGYVLVPAKATTIVTADIENVATVVAGALAPSAGSVGTSQIAAEAVTAAKLAGEAVTGPKLGAGTVRQETGTAQSFLSWGMISEAAAIEASTGDFTITKTGTGEYEVTWTKAKSSANYAVLVVTRLLVGLAEVSGQTTAKFNIKTGQVAEPGQVNLKNLAFSLIAVAAS